MLYGLRLENIKPKLMCNKRTLLYQNGEFII